MQRHRRQRRVSTPFFVSNSGLVVLFLIAFMLGGFYFASRSHSATAGSDSSVIATPTIGPPPAPTPTFAALGSYDPGYVPILMYHYIRTVDEASDPLGYRLSVDPATFAQQMDWIATQGYTPMRMRDLADCLRSRMPCPMHPLAITFDDGYDNHATQALPILQRYHFPATFYIVGNFVGQPNYMTWEDLARLREAGMELGAHTMTHLDLATLGLPDAQREIVDSRSALERQLGIAVLSFSYPAGSYTPEVATLVREAGFSNAVTTLSEHSFSLLYELPRRRIVGGEGMEAFRGYVP